MPEHMPAMDCAVSWIWNITQVLVWMLRLRLPIPNKQTLSQFRLLHSNRYMDMEHNLLYLRFFWFGTFLDHLEYKGANRRLPPLRFLNAIWFSRFLTDYGFPA